MMKMTIDPNEFALTILKGNPRQAGQSNEAYIKGQLLMYLEAYLLIHDFDELEQSQFDKLKKNQIIDLLDKLLNTRMK